MYAYKQIRCGVIIDLQIYIASNFPVVSQAAFYRWRSFMIGTDLDGPGPCYNLCQLVTVHWLQVF